MLTEGKFIAKTRSGRPVTKLQRAQRYGAGGFSPQRGSDSTLAAALCMEYGASCTRLHRQSQFWRACVPWGWPVKQRCFAQRRASNTHKGSIFSLGLLCAAIGRLYQLRQPIAAEMLRYRRPFLPRPDRTRTAPEQPLTGASGCISNWD